MKARFQLYHTQYGETTHLVEMDTDLINPEAGIIDPNTFSLRPLKGGGVFTLIPLEVDHRVACLRRVHEVYEKITTEPAGVPSAVFNRMDSLFSAVGLLFDKVEYYLVECKEDLQDLIITPADEDYKPKKVEYNILGDMLAEILEENKAAVAKDDGENELVDLLEKDD